MADHYSKALAYLDEVQVKRADLLDEYADPDLRRASVISQLHQDIGSAMKLAHIHMIASVQAEIRDVRASIESTIPRLGL